MIRPPCIVLLESNTSGTGRQFARAARTAGFMPVIFTADPSRYPYIAGDDVPWRAVDSADVAAVVSECRRLDADVGVVGIGSSSEYYVATAAETAAMLGLPGPAAAAVRQCRNKLTQRRLLAEAGVTVPAFAPARTPTEAVEVARSLGWPVIVKPLDGSGSVGVRLCAHELELTAHVSALLAETRDERGRGITRPAVLVEAFVDGPEFSVETFGYEVLGVTAKHLGGAPFFVEIGHEFPADLTSGTRRALATVAVNALQALGLGWGPAHTEIRVARADPHVIEVNPRLAGGYIPELVRQAIGIDQIAQVVRLLVGRPLQLRPTACWHAGIRFLLAPGAGRFAGVAGIYHAEAMPFITSVATYPRPGAAVAVYGDFRDRVGHVIAAGPSAAVVRRALDEAASSLMVCLESLPV